MKKDGDVEMKSDEPSSSTPHGDVSPINASLSNLADSQPAEPRPSSSKRKEPTFENLGNLSRVTPAQFAHIVFPAESRYQPVRPVSTRPASSGKGKVSGSKTPVSVLPGEKYAGGGGILMLIDQRPKEASEFIAFFSGPIDSAERDYDSLEQWSVALDPDEPEAELPRPFEVCFFFVIIDVGADFRIYSPQYPFDNDT